MKADGEIQGSKAGRRTGKCPPGTAGAFGALCAQIVIPGG